MISKELRDYKWEIRPIVVFGFIVVSPAIWLIVMWLWSLDGVDWPSWVQAVGSVIAIFVAIGVARQGRRDMLKLRVDEEERREKAQAERLNALINEVNFAVRRIVNHFEESESPEDAGVSIESIQVLDLFLQRALSNFDDDVSPARHRIASRIRFNLASFIHVLRMRIAHNLPADFLPVMVKAKEAFEGTLKDVEEHYEQIFGVKPRKFTTR